jgi:hypothetical protein
MKLNEQRIITTTLNKAILTVSLSILGGIVAGAFAWGNLINSDHFTLAALVGRVDGLEKDHTSKAEVATIIGSFQGQLTDIKKTVENTNSLIIGHITQTR